MEAGEEVTPLEQYDSAVATITEERGKDYGHPINHFGHASRLKDVVAECPDPHIRHALEMICVKMARLIESPEHLDSWVDISGYARTAVMCIDYKENER